MTRTLWRSMLGALLSATSALFIACSKQVQSPTPVLEPPSVDATPPPVDPEIICRDQRSSRVTLHGASFAPVPIDVPGDPKVVLPSIELTRALSLDGAEVGEPDRVIYSGDPDADPTNALDEDNELIEVDGEPLLRWQSQAEMSFLVTQDLVLGARPEGGRDRDRGPLPVGIWDVTVRNPGGQAAQSIGSLAVVPAPQLESRTELVCLEQGARTLLLGGQSLLRNEAAQSQLAVEGVDERFELELSDCQPIAHEGVDAELCRVASVELAAGAIEVGYPALTLENPAAAACTSEEEVALRVVAAPSIERVVEPLACIAQGRRTFVIEGESFLRVDGTIAPIVFLGAVEVAIDDMACEVAALPAGEHSVELCSSITFSLVDDDIEPGVYDVRVVNPDDLQALDGGCSATRADGVRITAPPAITQLEPAYVCLADGAREVTLTGGDFLVVDGVPPSVELGGTALDRAAVAPDDCDSEPLDVGALTVRRCGALVLTLEQSDAELSSPDVTITNPEPAGCQDDAADLLATLAAVRAPEIAQVAPDPVCLAQGELDVVVTGASFVRIGSEQPSVAFGELGNAVQATAVAVTDASCTPIAGAADAVTCTELTGTLAMSALRDGTTHRVTVTNPSSAACASQELAEISVVPPPTITSIDTATVCTGGGAITITGTNLAGVTAQLVDPDTQAVVEAISTVVSDDGTSATITFGSGVAADTYELRVAGAHGCSDVATSNVTASIGPVAYFMDPPVAYSGSALRGTLYASGVSAAPASVFVTPRGGAMTDQELLTGVAWPASGSNNKIGATIPEGLDEGVYDVTLDFTGTCDSVLPGGLTVEADVTLALETPALEPQFGEQNTSSAVSVLAEPNAELGTGEVNFEPTPRAYLSSTALAAAEPLRAVQLDSEERLTAIVPDTLAAGVYDLIVVNPDGSVGFQAGAYEATAVAPPVIDSVAPTQLDNDMDRPITIAGGNFINPTTDMAVTLACLASGATTPTTIGPLAIGGASTAGSLIATVTSSSLAHGTICAVRVTNTTNGTFDELSAITVTNPASKLPVFQAGSALNEGRRAPAVAFGSATNEARFLYAIGGDDGAAINAKASVEAAPIGRFGVLGAWRTLATELPAGITQAQAASGGRYLYLFGGLVTDAATAPTAAIHRAAVLRPDEAPMITGVDLRFFGGPVDADPSTREGLAPGAFTYVIAAVFDAADTDNPGGESLPSEPLTLYAPDVPDGIEVQLTWDVVLGADGVAEADTYRIYRTAAPDSPVSTLALLAEVAAPGHSYIDQNPAVFLDATKAPLAIGDLGAWRPLPATLNTARAAYGLALARDPSCNAYLYIVGGRAGAATESASYEYATFDVMTGALGAFTQATGSGLGARREHALFVADGATSAHINPAPGACESYVYASSGFSGATSFVTTIQEAAVQAGGGLGAFTTALASGSSSQTFAGHAAFFSSDSAYVMGGASSTGTPPAASSDAQQAELSSGSVPNLGNFSSASSALLVGRYLPGFAREGAFFYLVGGASSAGVALSSTERNVR